jgi:TonB family protein
VLQSESGPRAPALEVSTTDAASSRRGGDPVKSSGEGQPIPRVRRTTIDREGDADLDRLASVRAQLLNVPLVQSENLIIEKLVRPVYPELAQEQGIEGRVAVLALVDTLGRIHEVETVGASEDQLLMAAAEIAVKKCRFRPYKVDGRKQAVYAMFKFSFKLE